MSSKNFEYPKSALRLLGAVTLAGVMALSGCGSSGENPMTVKPGPNVPKHLDGEGQSTEQTADMADGAVTYDEYVGAWKRYVVCMKGLGVEVRKTGETDQIIDYESVVTSVGDEATESCYKSEFILVDMAWQQHRQAITDVPLIMACLQERNIEPRQFDSTATIDEQLDGLQEQILAEKGALDECLGHEEE